MRKIDLHNHTKCSDGKKTPIDVLKEAYELDPNMIISITDHNRVDAYYELKKDISSNKYIFENLKIIFGTELSANYANITIDILGYNYDLDLMKKETDKLAKKYKRPKNFLINNCLRIAEENNLVLNDKVFENCKLYISTFHKELLEHEENHKLVNPEISFKQFFINEINNPQSIFYINYGMFRPKVQEVIDAIHNANGIAFLAHPIRYNFSLTDNIEFFVNAGIDGLEVWYPMHDTEYINYLLALTKKYNLKVSGGSDNHNYPDDTLGCVNLRDISQTNWINETIEENKDFYSIISK